MDRLEQIEQSLASKCFWCCGTGTSELEVFWCGLCGGSGQKRTMKAPGLYPSLQTARYPAPYLKGSDG